MKITLHDVAEAIRKNGLIHTTGAMFKDVDANWIDTDNTESITRRPLYACALGTAAWNLDVSPHDLYKALMINDNGIFISSQIIKLNDDIKLSLSAIADIVEVWAQDNNVVVNVRKRSHLYKKYKGVK